MTSNFDLGNESDIFHEFRLYLPKHYQQAAQDSTKIPELSSVNQKASEEQRAQVISAIQYWGQKTISLCAVAPSIPLCDDIRGNDYVIDLVIGTIIARLAHYCLNIERFRSQSQCYFELEFDEITQTHKDVRMNVITDRDHNESLGECKTIIIKYMEAIDDIRSMIKLHEINLFVPLVLNSSRALIDTQFAAYQSTGYLSRKIKYAELSSQQMAIMNRVKQFLKQIIPSKAVKEALTTILKASQKYSHITNAEILQNYMMELVDHQIYFSEQTKPSMCIGFVALNGIVVSRTKLFDKIDEPVNSARLVVLFFHEAAHYVFRKASQDFAWVTPRHIGFDDLECGYLFEQILFGSFEQEIWNQPISQGEILNEKKYMQAPPILKPQDLIKQQSRVILNPRHSGLCIADGYSKEL